MKNLTIWDYSLDTEAKRILYTAYQTYSGFYKSNGFIVLPKNTKSLNSNVVILPKLNFNSIPKFWKRVSKIDVYSNPMTIDKNLIYDLKNLLSKYTSKIPNYYKTMNVWKMAEKEILNTIYDILPNKKNKIKKIIINPTKIGTICSFSRTKDGTYTIQLRDDQSIWKIAEAIVTSITREDVYKKLNGLWQESEIIADFLVTQTKIATILQKYEPHEKFSTTIKGLRSKNVGNFLQESNEYHKDLGLPNFDQPFSLRDTSPVANRRPLLNLSSNEKEVMSLLIKNSNRIVNVDEISDILFLNEDKFSLFALSKFIQRLREKLEQNGISGNFIQTIRGKGYVLKN